MTSTGNNDAASLEQYFSRIFDVVNQGIFRLDSNLNMQFQNPSFYSQFDIDTDNATQADWEALIHPDDFKVFHQHVDSHFEGQQIRMVKQYRIRNRHGEYIWLEGTGVIIGEGDSKYMVGSHKDITEQKQLEIRLRDAAYRDNSTGINNRQKLIVDIAEALEFKNNQYALIYIQVGHLKSYINQFGGGVLEDLLSHIINAFDALSNNSGQFYRVRTDEFAVLLKGEYSSDSLAAICYQLINYYRDSSADLGQMYGNDLSIGVYPFDGTKDNATDIVQIAARTCEYAQGKANNNLEIFNTEVQQTIDRFFYIEQGLKNALNNDEINVKFQPIVCAKTGMVSSFEALARWRSEQYGEIYPDEFIPVAEKNGLIIELGYKVFEKACEFILHYNADHNSDVKVNVNVSVLQLLNGTFPGNIKMMADTAGVNPKNIVIELTETIILDENPNAIKQLKRLSSYGFNLSLDDFGAGNSSLNSFFDLPLDQIKIDKSMVWKAEEHSAPREYIEFLIKLCNSRNVNVVVEGIENANMCHLFETMGANFLQGFWFSKPLSTATASSYTLNT